MFRELKTLINARPLTLTVVALSGDRIRVCVIPQRLEADNKINAKAGHHKDVAKIPDSAIEALTTPLCLEGTAEQLDVEMPEKLTRFTEAHSVLRGALDQAQEQISQAVQAIEDRNKLKSKAKQGTPAGKDNKDSGATDKASETHQSDSLPLEWIAPPSSSAAQDSNANPKLISDQEAAAK
jgi:PRTRC genetic system protein E